MICVLHLSIGRLQYNQYKFLDAVLAVIIAINASKDLVTSSFSVVYRSKIRILCIFKCFKIHDFYYLWGF